MNELHSTTRRQLLIAGASTMSIAGAGVLSLPSAASAEPATQAAANYHYDPKALPTGDIHDFDFFVGKWHSANLRLKQRWAGSQDWDSFPNTVECGSHLDGVVNIDQVVFPTKGWSGMTLRTFSLAKRQWSLYWINSRTGELFPPVVGGFSGDVGLFYGDDTDDGRPIKVVFHWTRLGPGRARWQQAFSLDGKQWETNWIVEHTRIGAT